MHVIIDCYTIITVVSDVSVCVCACVHACMLAGIHRKSFDLELIKFY